jgi:hypothetical protein
MKLFFKVQGILLTSIAILGGLAAIGFWAPALLIILAIIITWGCITIGMMDLLK